MSARPPKAPPIPPLPGLELLADDVAYAGRFALQIVRFRRRRFDGRPGRELTWELWRRGRGVAVLPYDPWSDRVALIEQFRLPAHAAGLDPVMVEIVAGLLEEGEEPEAAARRECAEESGLVPDRMERIGRYMLMQGGCDETMFFYCGRVRIAEGAAAAHGLDDEGEDIRLLAMPADEAFDWLDSNRVENATAALCLQWLRHHRARLRREWA